VQTTLLSLAVAIILALVTALVGPLLISWGDYRAEIEAEASRLAGVPVKISGPIDMRLLPTPRVHLQGVQVGAANETLAIRLREVRVEMALGPLLRGAWRATDLDVDQPTVTLGLDESGRLPTWPVRLPVESEALSIETVTVRNGRLMLADKATGRDVMLEDLSFRGDMRSLIGPVRGEGAFRVGERDYPYRLTTGRRDDDGRLRIRLSVDPIARPVVEAEGLLALADGKPRFDGTLTASAPAGRVEGEPWRVTAQINADTAGARASQIEIQHGPDERAVRLKGEGRLAFGGAPSAEVSLAAAQLDLDRLFSLPEEARQTPAAALRAVAKNIGEAGDLPFPLRLAFSGEAVTLAGAPLQRMAAQVRREDAGWIVDSLEFRAPGFTQLRASGTLSGAAEAMSFAGPVRFEATDPKAFATWLSGRSDAAGGASEPLRFAGSVVLGARRIAITDMKAELEQVAVVGRLDYRWTEGPRPARLEAVLRSPGVDLDRLWSVGRAVAAGVAFDWPREGMLELDLGRATLAGVEGRGLVVKTWLDPAGFSVERLTVADFGGARLTGSGRIELGAGAPRGTVSLDMEARRLDGPVALLAASSPRLADAVRRVSGVNSSGQMKAVLTLDDAPETGAAGRASLARLTLDGRLGEARVALAGRLTGTPPRSVSQGDPQERPQGLSQILAWEEGVLRLDGRIEADDTGALVSLLGLDRVVAAERRPGRLALKLNGPLGGAMTLDASVSGGGLDGRGNGTVTLGRDGIAAANLALDVAGADLRPLRRDGRAAVPVRFTAQARADDKGVALKDVAGAVAGAPVKGHLAVTYGATPRVEGTFAMEALDAAALLSPIVGLPAAADGRAGGSGWSGEPFGVGMIGTALGRIGMSAARATLPGGIPAEALRFALVLGHSEITLEDVAAELPGGPLKGTVAFLRGPDGALAARGRLTVDGVQAGAVLPPVGETRLNGRLSADLSFDGAGRSPAALIGSLGGSGSVALRGLNVAGLDAGVFDAVTRAVDDGLALDPARVGARVERAFAGGRMGPLDFEGPLGMARGQLRFAEAAASADGADVTVSGSYNLGTGALDARIGLAPAGTDRGAVRPELTLLFKGPREKPVRSLDVSTFSGWLALRSVEQQTRKLDEIQKERARQAAETARAAEEAEKQRLIQLISPSVPVLVAPSETAVEIPGATAPPTAQPVPFLDVPTAPLAPLGAGPAPPASGPDAAHLPAGGPVANSGTAPALTR